MCASTVSLDLAFRDTEHLRYAYHSFANLINVVHAELQLLERMSGPEAGLRPSIRLCEAATWAFKESEAALEHGAGLIRWRSRIEDDLARVQVTPAYEADGEEARELIRQVIDDADLRIQEMLARHEVPRPAPLCEGSTIRSLVLAGAEDTLRQARADLRGKATDDDPDGDPENDIVGFQAADRLRITTAKEVPIPHGLAQGVGRLAAALLATGGGTVEELSVDIRQGPSQTGALISVTGESLSWDLLPRNPPSSIDLSDPEDAARSLVALVSYLAGPRAEVVVDPEGAPLLLVRPR